MNIGNIVLIKKSVLAELQRTGLNLYRSKELVTETFSIERENKGIVKSVSYFFNTHVIVDGEIVNMKVSKSSDVEGLVLTKEGQAHLQILKDCEDWVEGKPLHPNWRVNILHYEYRYNVGSNKYEPITIPGCNIKNVTIYPEGGDVDIKVTFTDNGFTHSVFLN